MTSVCTLLPWVIGFTPAARPSSLVCTISLRPSSLATYSSRSLYISRNFQVVSMCISGKGGLAGKKAFSARRSITAESLPIE